jgi:hypothetical protein
MSTTPTVSITPAALRRTAGRRLLVWSASFLSVPAAGYLATLAVGRTDNPGSAVVGGALLGAIMGLAQALLSSGRLPRLRWTVATLAGAGIGVGAGAAAVDYGTTLADLATGGLITGAIVGISQALALPPGARVRWSWAVVTAALWPLAWVVTTLAGIKVGEQFVVFGSSGAIVYTVLAGLALQFIVPDSLPAQAER